MYKAHTEVIKVMAKAVSQTEMLVLVLSFFLSRINEIAVHRQCVCVYSVQQTLFQSPIQ